MRDWLTVRPVGADQSPASLKRNRTEGGDRREGIEGRESRHQDGEDDEDRGESRRPAPEVQPFPRGVRLDDGDQTPPEQCTVENDESNQNAGVEEPADDTGSAH